jgi:20S proteasome subunit alpha 6
VPAEGPFRILEGMKIDMFLKSMVPKTADIPEPLPSVAPTTTSEEDVQMSE